MSSGNPTTLGVDRGPRWEGTLSLVYEEGRERAARARTLTKQSNCEPQARKPKQKPFRGPALHDNKELGPDQATGSGVGRAVRASASVGVGSGALNTLREGNRAWGRVGYPEHLRETRACWGRVGYPEHLQGGKPGLVGVGSGTLNTSRKPGIVGVGSGTLNTLREGNPGYGGVSG